MLSRVSLVYIFLFLFFSMFNSFLYAGTIYFYKDEEGVLHFTNIPDSPNYRVYISQYSLLSKKDIKELVKRYSKQYGVDYSLVLAILEVESNFDPYAVSHAGAQGLMQIMPITQRELEIYSPYDPEENLQGGIKYLKRLLDKYKDIKLALAAYNAGPGAVDSYGGIPPFKETRRYVREVLNRYNRLKKKVMGKK